MFTFPLLVPTQKSQPLENVRVSGKCRDATHPAFPRFLRPSSIRVAVYQMSPSIYGISLGWSVRFFEGLLVALYA